MDLNNILLADNELSNLKALARTLRDEYNVFLAVNSEDMLTTMDQNDIALVLANYRMPGVTNFEVLETLFQKYPDTIYMIIIAYSEEELIAEALKSGRIFSYITKPWEPEEVKANVREGIDAYELNHAVREPSARALFDSGIVTKEQLELALNVQRTDQKSLKDILLKYCMVSESQMEMALKLQKTSQMEIEDALIEIGALLPDELKEAQEIQRQDQKRLSEVIIDLRYTGEDEVYSCYASRLGVPYISLSQFSGRLESTKVLPSKLVQKHGIIPIDLVGQIIVLAVSEPLSDRAKRDIEQQTGYKAMAFCASHREIRSLLEEYCKPKEE